MFLIPLNISELTTSQIYFETVRLPGGAAIIFPKSSRNQKWKKKLVWKNLSLPLTSGVKFFFRPTTFDFSFSILATFWKNDCSATWKPNSFKNNLACGQVRNIQRYQKHVPLVRWFIFGVSYMFESTVNRKTIILDVCVNKERS